MTATCDEVDCEEVMNSLSLPENNNREEDK